MTTLQNAAAIAPELGLALLALVVMMLDALGRGRRVIPWLTAGGALAAVAAVPLFAEGKVIFSGALVIDPLAVFFKVFSLLAVGLVALLSLAHRPLAGVHEGEYHTVLLLLAVALMILAGAANLLMIYLALEMVSLSCYLLTGHLKGDRRSSEAALKYFLFGALCSGLMLYGMTILYGLTGTLDLAPMAGRLAAQGASPALALALLMLLAGLGFKIAAAPFHAWAPDAYEGAPTPVTALLSVASKAGGFAVLLRVLAVVFPAGVADWTLLVWVLSALTMTVSNIIAVKQTNVKRLLAYSSIAQAGYVLMGLAVMRETPLGMQGALIYLLAYLFMNLGAFAVVIAVSNALGSDEMDEFGGLAKRSPGAAAALTVFLLSLTGIPPMAGFVGKFVLFAAVIEAQFYALALIAAVNSVVAAFYYFRIVRAMYLEPAGSAEPVPGAPALRLAVALTLAGTLAVGLWPAPFLSWATAMPMMGL